MSRDAAARVATSAQVPRPFQHQRHEDLPCRGCHGAGATHRTTRVRSPRDCAACHHDPARGLSCTKCHGPGTIPAERTVRLTLALRVAPAPQNREVTFRHDVHVAESADLDCTDCHGSAVTLQRNRECGSCHASHHAGKAECAKCHATPPRRAHDASAHLTCSGGGCHAVDKAPTPTLSRTLCVFCHADRRDHEPGGSCAACHRIPGGTATGSFGHAFPVRGVGSP